MVDEKQDAKALVAVALKTKTTDSEPVDETASPQTDEREVTRTMAGTRARRAAADLVGRALGGPAPDRRPNVAEPLSPANTEPAGDSEARELIEVYFELEEPAERDALFDQLVAIQAPLVTDFLRVMMHEDEDEYVRAGAAAELARRGVAEAIEVLAGDLEDPEEPFFFEQAVQVLAEVLGADFYDPLVALWRDPNRDADQRREAMLGLESIDAARALADFVTFLEEITDIQHMPDDQVEVAMMAFARHEHASAKPALEALRLRVLAAPIDESERAELAGFIGEGLALL